MLMAATLDEVVEEIAQIQRRARADGDPARRGSAGSDLPGSGPAGSGPAGRPRWPMIVLRTPKGWTGPKVVDGLPAEGTLRSHQVPLTDLATKPEHLAQLEEWLRSYKPEELFDERGALRPELAALRPQGERRMGANPHANGGLLLRALEMPDFRELAVEVPQSGGGCHRGHARARGIPARCDPT